MQAVKRVAIVISELRPGGAERVVVHVAGTLAARGVEPLVVCLQRRGPLGDELLGRGVRVVALESLRGYDIPAVVRLARVLRQFRPDVINVHDRSSLPYAFIANRLGGRRPMVFSCHGLLLQDESRLRRRDRMAARDLRALTAVSEQAGAEYARMLNWPGRVDLVPNGVPLPPPHDDLARASQRSQLGVPQDAFVFLAVGNSKPEKGYEDLLEAAALLRHCGRRFLVLVAGAQPADAYADSLASVMSRLGLDGTVRFLGYRADVAALYSAADAFVLSSRKEGLPMVLLEAMAAGLPVVATRVGAVPSVVQDGSDGLLVDAAFPAGLAEAMLRLLSERPLGNRLGKAARSRIRERYSVERMTEGYLAVFERAALSCAEPPPVKGVADSATRPRVLMLGPMPPLTGGMATVVENLRQSPLADRCRLLAINNGKTTPAGRTLLAGLLAQARLAGGLLVAMRRHRAEIVHIHTCALFSFWRDILHMTACRMLGRKVVWHIHDGSFAGFMAKGSALRRGLIRTALKAGAAVIVLGEQSLRNLRPMAPDVRWRVVPNGVPVPRTMAEPSAGPTRFLFLGNLTRRKGAFDLVDAAEEVYRKGLDITVRLGGGETSPGQKDELVRHIGGLNCRDHIALLGVVSGAAKERALAESDCLVLPSYAEGLPMAVLEGMAYGLPVIATRIGAIPEAVTDGQEGFLIEPGDVKALADRMGRIGEDKELGCRMGAAARARVEQTYSLDVVSDQVMNIYREALDKG
ncbi:MAG: glycosyltransferase family 4 protein [Planctomycetes bacterium]|nr:glycosyltransferase family 4 protein [Planctomycetota bacterium]